MDYTKDFISQPDKNLYDLVSDDWWYNRGFDNLRDGRGGKQRGNQSTQQEAGRHGDDLRQAIHDQVREVVLPPARRRGGAPAEVRQTQNGQRRERRDTPQ